MDIVFNGNTNNHYNVTARLQNIPLCQPWQRSPVFFDQLRYATSTTRLGNLDCLVANCIFGECFEPFSRQKLAEPPLRMLFVKKASSAISEARILES